MKFASLVAPVFLAAVAVAQSLTLNTPTPPVVCQPLLITWTGGTPPFILSVHDGANPNGPAIQTLGTELTGSEFTWIVNVSPGSIGLKLIDSTGRTSQTSSFDVLDGPDTDCVGVTPSSDGDSDSPSTTTIDGDSEDTETTAAPTTGAPATTGTSPSITSSSPPGATSAASDQDEEDADEGNAALSNTVNTGLLGLAAAVLLAVGA